MPGLRAPHEVAYSYRRSTGGAVRVFLAGLAAREIWGSQSAGGRIEVPPVDWVAGIGLLGKTRWGITLGIGTAGVKLVRMGVLYGYFALALAPPLAERGAAMDAQLMAVRQPLTTQTALLELDPGPLVRVYGGLYPSISVALLVLGTIYPAISLWVLNRARRKSILDLTPPNVALNETSPG